jgi:hypothetical protein
MQDLVKDISHIWKSIKQNDETVFFFLDNLIFGGEWEFEPHQEV